MLLRQCDVQAVDYAVCAAAHANSDEQDYDEAVIAACALAASADVLLSSGAAAFERSAARKMSPEAFAEHLAEFE